MSTTVFTPLEVYLATTWRPDREYIDGEVRERNLGEYDHADLQTVSAVRLSSGKREWNVKVVVEQRVQVSPTHYRVPDITVISADLPREKIITRPPLICIEVLSKDDTLRGMQERVSEYAAMGVPNIWLFEPETREVWVCTADSMTKVTGGVLAARGTSIVIPLDEIWADVD